MAPPGAERPGFLELDDVQQLIVDGYGAYPECIFGLFEIEDPVQFGAWLKVPSRFAGSEPAKRREARAAKPGENVPAKLAIAFSRAGLERMNVPEDALKRFVPEFQQGMRERARTLGDVGRNAPEAWAEHWRSGDRLHVFIGLYATSAESLESGWIGMSEGVTGLRRIHHVRTLVKRHATDPSRWTREPFGFRDGISQPYVIGSGTDHRSGSVAWNRVQPGEFILGYRNQMGAYPASPWISDDPDGLLPPADRSGRLSETARERRDLGRNGSYLVVRELMQHVEAFERLSVQDQELVIGRTKDGVPLHHVHARDEKGLPHDFSTSQYPPPVGPDYDAVHGDPSSNDFTYHATDRIGLGCPMGAHVRRANPRDSFASDDLGISRDEALQQVNRHRLLRRGRVFLRENTSEPEGLFFMCLNANIERQFEFVQQSWIQSPSFGGLQAEMDPLLGEGDARKFTVTGIDKDDSLELGHYVTVKGGEYFFLPGRQALHYLAHRAQKAQIARGKS